MRLVYLLSILAVFLKAPVFACTPDGKEGLVPENDMYIPADAKSMKDANISKEKFNEVIDHIVTIYAPIVRSFGGELKAIKEWDNGTVNAYAHRNGGTWNLAIYGGLARHPDLTADGLALATCHEIGHHIGGAPKKFMWFTTSWITNEGQADYFATLKCLRKVWRSEDNRTVVSTLGVPQMVVDACAKQFTNEEDQLICQRSAMAGKSTARLFRALRAEAPEPVFDKPDPYVTDRTSDAHPATQCRMDTYFQGSLCTVLDSDDVDQTDESVGVCYKDYVQGLRPACWFKPKK